MDVGVEHGAPEADSSLEAYMGSFIFGRLRLLIVVVVLLPVVATISRRLADRLERRRGGVSTIPSRGLRVVQASATRARAMLR
ncbi:hypothetical protein ACPPVS_08825 [Cellulomonas sp. McL0617]|uniref:hypothetical protein n=1 Tax=Cellulomonas sp. McL0617 TaxID=3415675 RepID=UPI003CF0FD1F